MITTGNTIGLMEYPQYYNGKVYYVSNGIMATPVNTFAPVSVCVSGTYSGRSYNISRTGQMLYVTRAFALTDKRAGTLWLMDADGSNNHQLTFNN